MAGGKVENKYLLDTHAFLWATGSKADSARLGKLARETIEDEGSELYVSCISIFEITLKHRSGKLPEYTPIVNDYSKALIGIEAKELQLNWEQAHLAGNMAWEHKDPFDRMLAAQAQAEGMVLISCDKIFSGVPGLKTLW